MKMKHTTEQYTTQHNNASIQADEGKKRGENK